MTKHVYMVIFFLLMIFSIVGADVLFLRHHFVARLITNIGMVVVKRPGFHVGSITWVPAIRVPCVWKTR